MKEKILEINKSKNIFWMLLFGIALSLSFYIYSVSQTTFNIVNREKLENDMLEIRFSLSDLESRYMAKKNSVNLEYAYSIGFKDASAVKYISKKSLGKALSLNNEI